MTKSADIHVRTDPQTKAGAERLFSTFGITTSDAINMFLRQSLLVGGIPFEVRRPPRAPAGPPPPLGALLGPHLPLGALPGPHPPRYNKETEAAMDEARDIMAGRAEAKVYASVAEMSADIDGDGG